MEAAQTALEYSAATGVSESPEMVDVRSPVDGRVLRLLRESEGDHRLLPIYIGSPEASAIHYALEGVVPPRPFTHDLFLTAIEELGAQLTRVVVTDIALQTGESATVRFRVLLDPDERLSQLEKTIANLEQKARLRPRVEAWLRGPDARRLGVTSEFSPMIGDALAAGQKIEAIRLYREASELIAQSWSNLSRNRTRSLLTMLGIVWGTVAVSLLSLSGLAVPSVIYAFLMNITALALIIVRQLQVGRALDEQAEVHPRCQHQRAAAAFSVGSQRPGAASATRTNRGAPGTFNS